MCLRLPINLAPTINSNVNKVHFFSLENNIIHGCLKIWNFSFLVQLCVSFICCAHLWDTELNTQREIPHLRKPMHGLFTNFDHPQWRHKISEWKHWLLNYNFLCKLHSFWSKVASNHDWFQPVAEILVFQGMRGGKSNLPRHQVLPLLMISLESPAPVEWEVG